ncbi:MAG: hypothetical protein WB765_21845, partial [Acidimicrobiales bacterium]
GIDGGADCGRRRGREDAGRVHAPSSSQPGFAAACVGRLSEVVANEGHRCILYTALANPTPNSI